jgi:hypothetical protein
VQRSVADAVGRGDLDVDARHVVASRVGEPDRLNLTTIPCAGCEDQVIGAGYPVSFSPAASRYIQV